MAPSRTRVRSATTAVLTALGTLAAAAVVVLGGGVAHAAEVGTLTLNPATGTDTSTVSFTTHSTSGTGCPAATTNISAKAFGPGGWSGGLLVLSNTTSDLSTNQPMQAEGFVDVVQPQHAWFQQPGVERRIVANVGGVDGRKEGEP